MKKWSTGWIIAALLLSASGASMNSSANGPLLSDKPPMDMEPFPPTALMAAAMPEQETAVPQPQKQTASKRLKLERVNGIAISDDLKTVYELKGQPSSIEQDPLFKDERVFVYKDCRIGLYKNFMQYIAVPAESGSIDIDGITLPLELDKLKQALGTPDWTAEDGIVYRSGSNALKLFIDAGTGKLVSVHYFSEITS